MWISRAPASRSCAIFAREVVPRTIESSTTITRLPRTTSSTGESLMATPMARCAWLAWMNVRPT